MRRIWVPQLLASLMLLWALNPENPYGYYILLRWVCCGVFAYLAFKALDQGHQGWVWVLGITAAVYKARSLECTSRGRSGLLSMSSR